MSEILIKIGILMVIIGAVLHFAPWLVTWFGKLPGDIRIEKDHLKIFVPITSMILLSILCTILLHVFRR